MFVRKPEHLEYTRTQGEHTKLYTERRTPARKVRVGVYLMWWSAVQGLFLSTLYTSDTTPPAVTSRCSPVTAIVMYIKGEWTEIQGAHQYVKCCDKNHFKISARRWWSTSAAKQHCQVTVQWTFRERRLKWNQLIWGHTSLTTWNGNMIQILPMVASAVHYTVVFCSCESSERDRKRVHEPDRSIASVLGCSLDSTEEMGRRGCSPNLHRSWTVSLSLCVSESIKQLFL